MKLISPLSATVFTLMVAALPASSIAAPSATALFIDGWKSHDVAKIESAFAKETFYTDEVLRNATDAREVGEYAAGFKEATFALEKTVEKDQNNLDLHWSIRWPDARGTLHYVDHIILNEGKIAGLRSETTDPVPAASIEVIKNYYSTWTAGDKIAIKALFGKNGSYMDRYVPAGARGEGLNNVIVFHSRFDSGLDKNGRVAWTKDGRFCSDFKVFNKGSKTPLVHGHDLMRILDGTFDEVIGVF